QRTIRYARRFIPGEPARSFTMRAETAGQLLPGARSSRPHPPAARALTPPRSKARGQAPTLTEAPARSIVPRSPGPPGRASSPTFWRFGRGCAVGQAAEVSGIARFPLRVPDQVVQLATCLHAVDQAALGAFRAQSGEHFIRSLHGRSQRRERVD